MKSKIRTPFSLIVLTVFTVITLTCRTTLLRLGLTSFDLETTAFLRHLPPPPPAPPIFNSTLLKQAEIQTGEAKFKKEIDKLLEGNLGSLRTHRTFATWRRFSAVRVRAPNGLPLTLRSPVFYRYWLDFRKNLSEWARKKRFRPEVLSDLVSSIKHPLDKHFVLNNNQNQNKKYSSCAVVGNSGILLNNEYGKEIDGHDIVIRLNNARIDNYKAKVGSKTNISFINSNILHLCARRQGCFCHPYGKNVPIIMYICQPLHFLDYSICNSSERPPLIVTDPSFDVMCSRVVKYYSLKRFMDMEEKEGREKKNKTLEGWSNAHEGSMFHYSSGMQAVMMSIGICEKVSLFGFGKSSLAKHHYHTNQKAELSLHDYEAEYDFYHDLMNRPNEIPFFPKEFKVPPVVLYR